MNWDAVGALAELAGAIGVIATLIYLSVQLRQNSALLASSVASSERDAINEVSRIIGADPAAALVFRSGLEDRQSLEESQRHQFDALMYMSINNYAEQFVNKGRFDPSIDWTLQRPGAQDWWRAYAQTYSDEFVAAIDQHLESLQSAAAQQADEADVE